MFFSPTIIIVLIVVSDALLILFTLALGVKFIFKQLYSLATRYFYENIVFGVRYCLSELRFDILLKVYIGNIDNYKA